MKLILFLVSLLFMGCDSRIVNVSATHEADITNYRIVNPEIVCDKRGYAYYTTDSLNGDILTPILKTFTGSNNTIQLKCEDL